MLGLIMSGCGLRNNTQTSTESQLDDRGVNGQIEINSQTKVNSDNKTPSQADDSSTDDNLTADDRGEITATLKARLAKLEIELTKLQIGIDGNLQLLNSASQSAWLQTKAELEVKKDLATAAVNKLAKATVSSYLKVKAEAETAISNLSNAYAEASLEFGNQLEI